MGGRARTTVVGRAILTIGLLAAGMSSATPQRAVADGLPVVYLTFDDGPAPGATPALLDLLAAHGAHATFFVIGQNAAARGDLVHRELAEGHAVGNHTWSHPELPRQNDIVVRQQLERTNAAITEAGGEPRCYRPPYGATDARVEQLAAEAGLRQVLWDVDTRDWERQDTGAILSHLGAPSDGMIVLLHDGGGGRRATLAATEDLLTRWAGRARFEAIPSCLTRPAAPVGLQVRVAPPAPVGPVLGLEPVATTRLVDTRPTARIPAGAIVRIAVPRVDAAAAAIDLVAAGATSDGYLQAWDCTGEPTTSVMNTSPGAIRTGSATVGLTDGAFCLRSSNAIHVVVDLTAIYRPAGPAARLVDRRAADTRLTQPLGPSWRPLVTDFPDGVTAAGAVVETTDSGGLLDFVAVLPCAEVTDPSMAPPTMLVTGAEPSANFVALGTAGGWCGYASSPRHVVVDVVTEWGVGTLGYRTVPPTRLLDTRLGVGAAGRLVAEVWTPVELAEAFGAAGLDVVLTSVGGPSGGYASVAVGRSGPPSTSSLQLRHGDVAVHTAVAGGAPAVFTSAPTDALLDVTGVYVATA